MALQAIECGGSSIIYFPFFKVKDAAAIFNLATCLESETVKGQKKNKTTKGYKLEPRDHSKSDGGGCFSTVQQMSRQIYNDCCCTFSWAI